jgi:hypothetical protein
MQRSALKVSAVIYGLVSLAHLVRFLRRTEVRVGRTTLPVFGSAPAAVFALILALWMAREAQRR